MAVAFLAFSNSDSVGFHSSGVSMWVLTIINDDRVPSNFSESLEGVLFLLMRENTLSSLAFEWGIVKIIC